MHDRETIYRLLWQFTDRNGMLIKKQTEIADEIGIPYQKISEILAEFVLTGRARKYKHKFQLMGEPSSFKWGDEYKAIRKSI